jgi:hypothetical protein
MAYYTYAEDGSGNLNLNPMIVYTIATTNSSGEFTVDITDAGLTDVLSVHATVIASGSSLNDAIGVSIYTFDTTTIAGIAYKPTTAVLGLLGITAVGSGVEVLITVIGDQN